MTPHDAELLASWETLATLGFWMVIVGVAGEGMEAIPKMAKWCLKKELVPNKVKRLFANLSGRFDIARDWLIPLEFISWLICVLGLAFELWGDFNANSIKDDENRGLNKLATDALDRAKNSQGQLMEASKSIIGLQIEAAHANERAATVESNNLVLRSNVVALESEMQWRTITPKQETDLIMLLKPAQNAGTKHHVIVDFEQTDFEARWYAKRIVDVLKECGFDANSPSQIGFNDPNAPIPVGLGFFTTGHVPPFALDILIAFRAVGIVPQVAESHRAAADDEVLTIEVWHKPEK